MPRGHTAHRAGMPYGGIAVNTMMPQCHTIPTSEMGAVRYGQLSRDQVGSADIPVRHLSVV